MEQFVRVIFSTHYYEWEGQLFCQVSGGPIGLRATGMIARVVMDYWAEQIMCRATQCRVMATNTPSKYVPLNVHALWKYVDDCVTVTNRLKLGTRWSKSDQAMVWSKVTEAEDLNSQVSADANTVKQFAIMASEVMECLNFTYDVPENG